MTRSVWYQLADEAGDPFEGMGPNSVSSDGVVDLHDLRAKIHEEYNDSKLPAGNLITSVPVQLEICNEKSKPLDEDLPIGTFGDSPSRALLVVVPSRKRKTWIQLKTREAQFVVGVTGVASVSLSDRSTIKQLLNAVKEMYDGNLLKGIPASYLKVFEDDGMIKAIEPHSEIGSRGETEDAPLDVLFSKEPPWLDLDVAETNTNHLECLLHYQTCGKRIQERCPTLCNEILDKIDEIYQMEHDFCPFICVQGSFGMGKSQLAFALGGRRPSFYWLAIEVKPGSQNLYQNFACISHAFQDFVMKDFQHIDELSRTEDVLDLRSGVYGSEMWTYGFIRALLECCSLEKHQEARQMIHFEESTTFRVEKCSEPAVRATIEKVKEEKKMLPFFVLDEMTSHSSAAGGMYVTAFQRNVFCVCGLVVIVMGSDSKITHLAPRSSQSRNSIHKWMSVVPRFPSFKILPSPKTSHSVWLGVVQRYSIVEYIALHSRGGFATTFVDGVVKFVGNDRDVKLWDLIDGACGYVSKIMHDQKHFMSSLDGKKSQVMAISFKEDDLGKVSPAKKRRLKDVSDDMLLHFANLVDAELTDISISSDCLYKGYEYWTPKCRFPTMEEDLLLYLAILGGKNYPSYVDVVFNMEYSTKCIFKETGMYPVNDKDTVSSDYKGFENLVAHAIFCSSRRNGVAGTVFADFFTNLLGEFQDERWRKIGLVTPVLNSATPQTLTAINLFEGYAAKIHALANRKIPFLAPPNAKWPTCIVDTHKFGCKFGHLVRATNNERCDVYVQDLQQPNEVVMIVCECKYWEKKVDSGTVDDIIDGLNAAWVDWAVVLVFCVKLKELSWADKNNTIGCVKISQSIELGVAIAHWLFQPERKDREKLVIVVETGLW